MRYFVRHVFHQVNQSFYTFSLHFFYISRSLNSTTTMTSSILTEAKETFLLLIGGILAEHDWLPIKIKLTNQSNASSLYSGKKTSLGLFLWVIEPNLKLVTFNSVDEFYERNVMKVLFTVHSEEEEENNASTDVENEKKFRENDCDQDLTGVPDLVIDQGIKYLIAHQKLIPQSQRCNANLEISYIDLSSVYKK